MTRKKPKNLKKSWLKEKKPFGFVFLEKIKTQIIGILMFILAIIVGLSFFELSGPAGQAIYNSLSFLIGKVVFLIPLILILGGLVFFSFSSNGKILKYQLWPALLAMVVFVLGISGILEGLTPEVKQGGWLGYIISWPFLKIFGPLVTNIIFCSIIIIGGLIFWQLLRPEKAPLEEKKAESSFFRKIFVPKFKVKKIEPKVKETPVKIEEGKWQPDFKLKEIETKPLITSYQPPPLELLETERGRPTTGDTTLNSAIIKKTLQNFEIPVEMSEINIGPTVTQYTLKPAEGVKLSKITALSNDLALALASHPIRIEAPIPGRSLVGIEVPNKERCLVRLRDLIGNPNFKKAPSNLTFVLGRDVSGNPVYADLAKMPHLLVAGSTGTGKTCAADTLMFTEKGMLNFEELCSLPLNSEIDFKVKLVTRDGIETTLKAYNNGICQFYKLSTRRGYQIEATAEHPLWVMNEDGSQGWKPASLIKKDDYVAISRGPSLFGNRTDISDFKPSKIKGYHRKISFPKRMTPQLAEFLGLLTADGGLSIEKKGTHRVVYTQANSYLLSLYKKLLKELFGITQFIEKRSGSNSNNKSFDIVIGSKHLKEFLVYLGMDSSKSPQKEIPRAIREAPKEIVTAYLRALLDNDGYVEKDSIEFSISSKKLSSQVHLMLLNFGIVSSLSIKKVKKYEQNEYYRLSLFGEDARKFIQNIGFIRKEKYNKVKEFLKLSPNPNLDLIPHISSLLRRMGQKYLNRFARLTNRGWQYQPGILIPKYAFSSLNKYNSGFRRPGYRTLEKILDFYQPISQDYNPPTTFSHSLSRMGPSEYQKLKKISERNFYWDKIEKIERTSGVGYDFWVPGSDSFIGNGFVNHNTIFLNSLILSLLYRNSPEILRFILIDPKRVEFTVYNQLPHLLAPVIYDAQKTVNALKWLVGEMERRFDLISEARTRDISSYNQMAEASEVIPYIVLIIDELADLMAAKGREIEAGIVRLAQMARAVGIHLVVATQRPSVEVITGLIKANITSRITFEVASQVDSRTILDMAGAEKLLGSGDMLFVSAEIVKPRRIQGAFVSEKEIKKVVNWIKTKVPPPSLISFDQLPLTEEGKPEIEFKAEEDPLYPEAKRIVIEAKKASASLLQRRLKIGYARAARLIDRLEERGVVGPAEGAKPREVYFDLEEKKEEEGWQKL
ncbi:MAG: DNA translocase FtsK [Patescibacteria group bacterium]|nr:DNA translocase FtsK [Patescibacteria group bacterium]